MTTQTQKPQQPEEKKPNPYEQVSKVCANLRQSFEIVCHVEQDLAETQATLPV